MAQSKSKREQVFDKYTCLLEVDSISNFWLHGWKIHGAHLKERRRGSVTSVSGDQKSGKTWICSRLLGHDLGADKGVSTTGVGMWVPPMTSPSTQATSSTSS